MTRFTGTLVRPLADQGDRDGRFIDPDGIAFEPGHDYPVFVEFDYARPLGYAVVSRAGDGSIVAEGEITEGDVEAVMGTAAPKLAAGIACQSEDVHDGLRGRVVSRCRLNAIGLTGEHSDPGQPGIAVILRNP